MYAGYATPTIQPSMFSPPNRPEIVDSDNIYLNVVFNNTTVQYPAINFSGVGIPTSSGGFSTGIQELPTEYNVTKTLPILDNCSDYYCSVVRFDIPLDDVPLYIVPIIPNQPDNNKTIYTVGYTFSGIKYAENVQYVPDNNIILPAGYQNQSYMKINPYYYVYTYNNLLNSINNTFDDLFAISGLSGVLPSGTVAPFITFNQETQLFFFTVPELMLPNASGGVDVDIFVNSPLQTLISSFQFSYNSPGNQPYGEDYKFILGDYVDNTVVTYPGATGNYIVFKEEYNTLQNWITLRKILITTNSIPIQSEFVPTFNNDGVQNSNAGSLNILTDFTPQIETIAGQSRTVAYYVPTSQYRLIDMKAHRPLYNIQLRILWQDKFGNLYPITIGPTQEASIKIAFLKKSLYKITNYLLAK